MHTNRTRTHPEVDYDFCDRHIAFRALQRLNVVIFEWVGCSLHLEITLLLSPSRRKGCGVEGTIVSRCVCASWPYAF